MRYKYVIEERTDSYPKSATYGRIIGWNVFDVRANAHVHSFLLCETGLMLASYPFTDKQVDRTEELARANGWDGKG